MTDEQKAKIDSMSRLELARMWRFAPIGDPLLAGEAGDYFAKRFNNLGGMNSQISKQIGWD